jgi:hypothetical protein
MGRFQKKLKRKYQVLWETALSKVLAKDFKPVVIKLSDLTRAQFLTIRQGFYKEKNLDLISGPDWRAKIEWDGDYVKFSLFSVHIEERF